MVGALVLKSWDLPSDLVEPVNWHHAPELSPEHSTESTLIALANASAHVMGGSEEAYMAKVQSLCPDLEVDLDEVMETAEELTESKDIEQFVSLLS